ncbi:hypothetical protein SAMN05216167_1321 [Spirosoma endophyticum]|uniref:Uncharacterized protein n=1 Tax=Spirosoma endophyticum TaxID=662367 RepID=A0A1I2GFX1_9BACT|nr:hypothetical protein SAMN05216167_1321 [Spirosoma endophyticum]
MEQPYTKISIRMNRSYSAFGEEQRNEFLEDLAQLTGSNVDDFRDVKFFKGCVISELSLPAEVVRRLLEAYATRNEKKKEIDELALEVRAFVKKHNVERLTDDFEVRLQILHRLTPNPDLKPKLLFVHGWRGGDSSFGVRRQVKVDKRVGNGKRQFSKLFHSNLLDYVQFNQNFQRQTCSFSNPHICRA